jgi:hypothetical protein
MLYEAEFIITDPVEKYNKISLEFWELYIAIVTELFRANDNLVFVDLQLQKVFNRKI